mmetsp:Transcript_44927/g.118929  ORF Transcript_44927/g.118929 Transcript_44927/m.118929 type:complete len:227 (-) Transcript_44927:2405-3085(-)
MARHPMRKVQCGEGQAAHPVLHHHIAREQPLNSEPRALFPSMVRPTRPRTGTHRRRCSRCKHAEGLHGTRGMARPWQAPARRCCQHGRRRLALLVTTSPFRGPPLPGSATKSRPQNLHMLLLVLLLPPLACWSCRVRLEEKTSPTSAPEATTPSNSTQPLPSTSPPRLLPASAGSPLPVPLLGQTAFRSLPSSATGATSATKAPDASSAPQSCFGPAPVAARSWWS